MFVLNEKEMWKCVSLEEIMGAVEHSYDIHRSGNYVMPDRYVAQRDGNMMLYMPCFIDGAIGTKMLAEFPGNPAKGLPYLSGLMIVNDSETGTTKAILNGSALTAMRTGAAGGVAVRRLSREDASSIGLVGCGIQGLHQLLFACSVRPIKQIFLYDAYLKDYNPFIERLKARLDQSEIAVTPCADTRALAERSDILISATQTTTPLYPDDEKLLEGKCFIAIGSWRPERRELPDAVFRLISNVYTEVPYACEETGDLKIPLDTGVLTMDRVKYMEDLIHDAREGRPHVHNTTTCFKSVGMGLYDVAVAELLCQKAEKFGIGQQIHW